MRMTLADRIAQTKGGSNQGLECSVSILLRNLRGNELAEFEDALADSTISHTLLERALRAEGHYVGTGTIGKHRRGDCRCSKDRVA